MKSIFICLTIIVGSPLCALAGTDMSPVPDSKEMLRVEPALRSDAGLYIAALGGVNFDTDYGDHAQTLTGDDTGTTISSHKNIDSIRWGGAGGLKVGYNFNSFALCDEIKLRLQPSVEAEALYIGTDRNVVDNPFGGGATETFSTDSGDFFLNGILRYKNESIVTPYIGAGPGLQYITTHGQFSGNSGDPLVTGVNTSDLDFAAQALLGFDVAVCKHLSLFSEYKFIDAIGTDAKLDGFSAESRTYRFKPDQIQQNLITAGLKYSF